MLTKNHEKLTLEVRKHIEADAVVQGTYWDGDHGCFIGCLAHSDDAQVLQDEYGLPLPLVRICESIFEALPAEESRAFFEALPEAVGRNGKDLSRVHWRFLELELRALPKVPPALQAVIDPIIAGMALLAEGKGWPVRAAVHAAAEAVRAAVHAAAEAARAAALVAHAAARAAAEAADAAALVADAAEAARLDARRRQRDTILQLISEAE